MPHGQVPYGRARAAQVPVVAQAGGGAWVFTWYLMGASDTQITVSENVVFEWILVEMGHKSVCVAPTGFPSGLSILI